MLRKRGEALLDAVHQATLEEVAEYGLRGASMDRIAHRAGTGKAVLYRRWPNVRALALDTFATTLEEQADLDLPDTGSLRGDLIEHFQRFTTSISGPLGLVLRELISEAAHDSTVATEVQARFGIKLQSQAIAMLQRAMARGEIPTRAVDPYILQIPAALVVHQAILTGSVPSDTDGAHIIDAIMLPLMRQP